MAEALIRHWHLLRAIPRHPQSRTTSQLRATLEAQGYSVTARSMQRDLISLSTAWGFSCDLNGRTQRWYWPPTARLLDVPNLGNAEALVFLLARQYLRDALPASQLRLLDPYFKRAEELLIESGSSLAKWRRKVRVIQQGMTLKIPPVAPGVLEAAHEALMHDRQLDLEYLRRGDKASRHYTLHPQGLVIRSGILYLIATLPERAHLLHFALHRAKSAAQLEAPAKASKGFDLDAYLSEQQAFSYPAQTGSSIRLVLRVNGGLRHHLEERPLSVDQVIESNADDTATVSATVLRTNQLSWWLLGLGDAVEVLKPTALRTDIRDALSRARARYGDA